MDKDRDTSRRRQVAGSVKELIGKLIGDRTIEDEGAREMSGRPDIRDRSDVPVPGSDKPD